MSEMIERVARAFEPDLWAKIDSSPRTFKAWADLNREDSFARARAAIEAMREPTDAMHNAARDWSQYKYGKPIGFDASNECWRVMIGAALSGGAA